MKFEKANFDSHGAYVLYQDKFVARFKRGGKSDFVSFLIKNFSVEEYFAALDAGNAPLEVLESKGYVSAAVKKALVSRGFSPSLAGKHQYLSSVGC